MRLINDEDFVSVARGPVTNIVPDLAHLVDAPVRGGINLDYVDGIALGDLEATRTHAARRYRRAIDTVQTSCQNPRNRCLASPPLAGKNVPVRKPVALN